MLLNTNNFGFFALGSAIHDERFEANANRAARNAFIVSVIVFVIVMTIATVTSNLKIFLYAFPVNFALLIMTFTISLLHYERKGKD